MHNHGQARTNRISHKWLISLPTAAGSEPAPQGLAAQQVLRCSCSERCNPPAQRVDSVSCSRDFDKFHRSAPHQQMSAGLLITSSSVGRRLSVQCWSVSHEHRPHGAAVDADRHVVMSDRVVDPSRLSQRLSVTCNQWVLPLRVTFLACSGYGRGAEGKPVSFYKHRGSCQHL